MTQTKFKKVPFNLELAKKITNKEVKGRISNGDGYEARIICWDKKCDYKKYPIIALVDIDDVEHIYTFTEEGTESIGFKTFKDLHLEVPIYYKDYSNFRPHKWQPCIVRDKDDDCWIVKVCDGSNRVGDYLFLDNNGGGYTWKYYLPLSNVTKHLVGTSKTLEELYKNEKE